MSERMETMRDYSDLPRKMVPRLQAIRLMLGHETISGFVEKFNDFYEMSYNRWQNYESPTEPKMLPLPVALALVEYVPGLTLDFLYREVYDGMTDHRSRLVSQALSVARQNPPPAAADLR